MQELAEILMLRQRLYASLTWMPTCGLPAHDHIQRQLKFWNLGRSKRMDPENKGQGLLSLTTEIVSAFAGNNTVAAGDLPTLISSVFQALRTAGQAEAEKPAEALVPAVPVKKSVTPEYIVCLEDGKKLKMLKRHLRTRYDMTPEAYRKRWGLPQDYPMVAPNYAAQRSALAKQIGLGRKPAAAPPAPEPVPATTGPRRRTAGRKKAA
jgi:predicted transcriptional regulator